jgi:PPOX class probable F420-dependent enzyme
VSTPAERFATAAVARLATVTPDGPPHLVPIVFAVSESTIYTAVDGKPKTSPRLRRLANIEANPGVSILVDHYDDDWSQLWWVRADGSATIHREGSVCDRGHELLRAKYPQYQHVPLDGPVIAVDVQQWSSWGG